MDKYSLCCGIANLLAFVILYTVCIILVVKYVSNIILIILLLILLFFICGYFEERILSGIINTNVEKFFE